MPHAKTKDAAHANANDWRRLVAVMSYAASSRTASARATRRESERVAGTVETDGSGAEQSSRAGQSD
jgi:hypothetical protein